MIRSLDVDALAREFREAEPFPHIVIDDFLEPAAAAEVAAAYPDFADAAEQGFEFDFVNEKRKVQICDATRFPPAVARLNEALAAPDFLATIEAITGIPNLVFDPELAGGGMHVTGAQGRLDVHVDFNYVEERALHRRLNILIYLNPDWRDEWGGAVEFWDAKVRHCARRVAPRLGRCVLFQTSEISFHGVEPVRCPETRARKSFAAYYYTREAPAGWAGRHHGTIFRARPDERFRRWVLMPAERARRAARQRLRAMKHGIKRRLRAS